jgi:molybdopterin-containing oxidoreductase family membrane subunit
MIEVGTLVGSFGLFFTCFLLFIRLLPMIAMLGESRPAGRGSREGAAAPC